MSKRSWMDHSEKRDRPGESGSELAGQVVPKPVVCKCDASADKSVKKMIHRARACETEERLNV